MAVEATVRARVDADVKQRAAAALDAMGLSIADAIRLLMFRVADDQRLPFDVKVPNATTRAAMRELQQGRGQRFTDPEALLKDLGI
jgi:DNA-damage-inducible protein J